MLAIASLNSSGEGEPTDKWCLDAKNMNSKIADAILELERSSMSDEEKKAYEEADEKIDEVSAKFEEFKAKAEQHHFIEYIWETFVPEEKKKRGRPPKAKVSEENLPPKKKRGRPPKASSSEVFMSETMPEVDEPMVVKKRPGRPPKVKSQEKEGL